MKAIGKANYNQSQIQDIYEQYVHDNEDSQEKLSKKEKKKLITLNKQNKKHMKSHKLSVMNLGQIKQNTGITNFKDQQSLNKTSPNNSNRSIENFQNSQINMDISEINMEVKKSKKKIKPHINVGFELFSLNLSRVLLIAIFLLITIPIFTGETYFKMMTAYQSGLISMGYLANKEKSLTANFDKLWTNYTTTFDQAAGSNRTIVYLQVNKVNKAMTSFEDFSNSDVTIVKELGSKKDLENVRPYAIKSFSSITDYTNVPVDSFYIVVFMDNSYDENIDAILGIFRTCFVLFVFVLLTYFFRRDTIKLLVQPMAKMKRTIGLIKKYPIRATNIIDFEFLFEYFEIQR